MNEDVQVYAIDANGEQLELDGIVAAMLRLIVKNRVRLLRQPEALLEIYYVCSTGKVHAKIREHIGMEKL